MPPLLARLLDSCRPREGWVPFLLVLIVIFCLPLILLQESKDLEGATLLILTALAVTIGLRTARSRLSGTASASLGVVFGLVLVVILVGGLMPPMSILWKEVRYAFVWLGRLFWGGVRGPLPFSSAAGYSAERLGSLGVRLWRWNRELGIGGVAQDSIIVHLLAAFLAWGLAFFAVWQIYRGRSILVGLLPSGAIVAAVAFFAGGDSIFYLLVYLLCTLILMGVARLLRQREKWEQAGTDYPGGLGMELALALAPSLAVILVLAVLFPVLHPRQIRDAFWKVMDAPWSVVEQASERLFGPMTQMSTGARGSAGSLPRGHLLGGAPELAETVVFYVTTDDPAPPLPDLEGHEAPDLVRPRRYWRSVTYDTYTGLGWTNGPLEHVTSASDHLLSPELPPGRDLRQHYDLASYDDPLLHAANAPLRIDHPVQAAWRAPGDLVQLSGEADQYTVISRPPEPTVEELALASPALPPGLPERHLALPDTVPRRVLELAAEVAGDAESHYDKAIAIEFFLRTYTYTLDLPSPPGNHDLVDYFLFDQQEGYCDYYASAMVVMARAVGVPARFATGFAQGAYDHDTGQWVVVEKDGHSWVEVYFDGIGWVEFEPTAGQPALVRTGGEATVPGVPALPPRNPGWPTTLWALLVLGGVLVLLGAIVVWIWRPRRRQAGPAAALVRDRQSRLIRWGDRLGQPFRDGQTPLEYSAKLRETIRNQGQASPWPQVQSAGTEAPAEIEHLTGAFVRAQYGPEAVTDRESWTVRDLWIRLRRRLWWLWLGRR